VRFLTRTRRALSAGPVGSLLILGTFLLCAVFADVLAPHDPLATNIRARLQPPAFQSGDWAHVLGTDEVGRDILSRLIYGARVSVVLGGASLLVAALIGIAIGMISGYLGGAWDSILMRVTDIALCYPVILLALLLATALGPQTINVLIAISAILWARFARVVRGEVLQLREAQFVEAAHTLGLSQRRIVLRHILPNITNTVMVLASLQLGWAILIEAALSFLGAGVPPPQPAWGLMASVGRDYIDSAWWVSAMPGLAIMLVVVATNLFGDWLRDRLDPRL
jgi:peptide/nickel transport system permease protein